MHPTDYNNLHKHFIEMHRAIVKEIHDEINKLLEIHLLKGEVNYQIQIDDDLKISITQIMD